jgi:hypothetical protein
LSVLSHGACGCFVHWRLGPSASPPHCCIAGRLLHLMAPVGPCTLLLFACVVSRCFGLPWFAIAALASHCPCMLGLRCVGWMLIVPRLRSASRGSSTLWRFRPSFGNNPEHPEVAISVCPCVLRALAHSLSRLCGGCVPPMDFVFGIRRRLPLEPGCVLGAESPLLIPPLLRLGFVGVLSSVLVALVI